jgi:CYTH domain-containing protein
VLALCRPGRIDKERCARAQRPARVEVDVFYGDNAGLVLAEIELGSLDEPYARPTLLGAEVTATTATTTSHRCTIPTSFGHDGALTPPHAASLPP